MTWTGRGFLAALGLAGMAALGGCAYDDGYGYGGVSVGTGYYGSGYYGPGYGYYPGYYSGWYDNYYYPGRGYYVYDRGGKRHRWNDGQRRYWEARRRARPDGDRADHARPPQWNGDRGRGPDRVRPAPGTEADGGRRYVPQRGQRQPQAGRPRREGGVSARPEPRSRDRSGPRIGGRTPDRSRPN